jgi:tetratricopeptide (TPR) repeat protein
MWIRGTGVLAVVVIFASTPASAQTQDPSNSAVIEAARLRNAGRGPEAATLLRSELLKPRQGSSPELRTAELTNYLGILLEDQGHYREAEACFRQAASDFETLLGAAHPRLAAALSNLGDLLVEEGRYHEAYTLIRRAIDIAVPVLGDCHPQVALMFGNLGHLFNRQGELARALPNARKQLACLEKQGFEDVQLGDAHQNLASLYLNDGQYSLAREHLERATAILGNLLPPDHPDLLLTGNTYLALDFREGRYKEARQRGLTLLEQVRGKLGPVHPWLAIILANTAYADQKLRLYEEAADCFQQAIALERQTVSSQDPQLAELLRGYADALRKTHRGHEAKKIELQAKAILANSIQ